MDESNYLRKARSSGWLEWVLNRFPPGQFGRYLVVGLANTAFGYGTYAGLTALFTAHIPFAYVLASVISSLLNITFSFLNYKWFIFETRGNYLREWSRCVVVYGGTYAFGVTMLPISVFLVRFFTPADKSAPYIAGAIQMGIVSCLGFLGHKNFSFMTEES
jgi:putative flippase GtrA